MDERDVGRLWSLGAGAFIWAIVVSAACAYRVRDRIVPENLQVRSFAHPLGALDHLVAVSDAQAFVQVARDPTMAHLGVWTHGPNEAALRYSRPIVGYLTWAASVGQARWAPYALVLIGCAACAMSIVLAALVLDDRRREWLVALLLISPAYLVTLNQATGDFTALAFALGGLLAWRRDRPLVAGVLFALAGLTHDHYLLIAAVVLVWAVVVDHERAVRRLLPIVLSPVPYLAWIVVVHARVGRWPWDNARETLGGPIAGLREGAAMWTAADVLGVIALAVLVAAAVAFGERGLFLAIAIAYVAFSVFFGWRLWKDWQLLHRLLLPVVVFSWLALLRSSRASLLRLQRTERRSSIVTERA